MSLFSKRKTSLDRRLSDLEKELDRIADNMKRAQKRAPRKKNTIGPVVKKRPDIPQVDNQNEQRLPPKRDENDAPIADDRFANYFTAGHFQNLRPLRQERRIVRNRALLMVVVVIIVLLWLLYFII